MKKKHNVFFLSFIVIFALVLISSQMVIGINAKFFSSDSATDSARVASFEVVADITDESNMAITAPIEMIPSGEITIKIKVESTSEVAVKGNIKVVSTGNLPLTITNGTSTFNMNAGGGTYETTVTISWPADKNDAKYSGEVDIVTISITTEQVD